MLTARDLMTPTGKFVDPDDRMDRALELMLQGGLTGLPVVNSCRQLLGVLTANSVRQLMPEASTDLGKVYHYMDRDVATVEAQASAFDLSRLFDRVPAHHVWVIDEGQLVGMVARRDVVRCVNALRLTTHRAHVDRSPAFGTARRSVRTNDGPVGNRLGNSRRVSR